MGGVQAKPNAEQRGHAAHIRQMDDNNRATTGQNMLQQQDRQFCNRIIHDPDTNHSPKYDQHLNSLKKQHYPPSPP
uniref:Uncharacterized protein n=1 Tax=Panagrolaimus sp. PS1159 TaxID=55785 RepID=A0AC35G5V8_9BILA